ncbi:MAG: hypothetical protein ABI743_02770, partial [bacterium]
ASGKLPQHWSYALEAATGLPDTPERDWAEAYRGEVRYYRKQLELAFRTTFADPDFPGAIRDLRYTRTRLAAPINEQLIAAVTYTTQARNLDRDAGQPTASRDERWAADLNYRFNDPWHLGLGFESLTRVDALTPAEFDTREQIGKVTLGRDCGTLAWEFAWRFGMLRDRQTDLTRRGSDYRASISWVPDPRLSLQLYGGLSTLDDSSLLGSGRNYAALRGEWRPEPDIRVTAEYSAYDLDHGTPLTQRGELGVAYTTTGGSEWALQVGLQSHGSHSTSYPVMLTYSTPFDLPVGKRHGVGDVAGRIVVAGDPTGMGIEDVVLTLGAVATLSGPDGSFRFPPLPPGTYTLNVDLSTLGVDRITAELLPQVITITGGETTNGALSFPAPLTSTEIEGDSLFSIHTAKTEPWELDNLYIELTNGTDTLRRVTTEGGHFAFERLRPGTWHLTVYAPNLPIGYKLPQDGWDITLVDGEPGTIAIELAPERREIKMVPIQ